MYMLFNQNGLEIMVREYIEKKKDGFEIRFKIKMACLVNI